LYLFSFSIAASTTEALGSGTNGLAVRISVSLTSPAPCTFNSWQK
jgi:hypothetical protein